jgi:transposase-like protein
MATPYSASEEMRNVHRVLGGNSEWKRSLGRPRYRCKDIKSNFNEGVH